MTTTRYVLLTWLLAIATGLTLGLGLNQVYLLHVGHDQSWCVYAADLVLRGVTLDGPRLVEVNPPFIIWFSCLPVVLGNILHLGILGGFRLFFDSIVVASLVWTTALIRKTAQPSRLSLILLVLAQTISGLWLIRQDSLGQREHMLVLLILPYIVLAANRLRRGGVRLSPVMESAIGLTAAIATCLKPQHIIVFVLLETSIVLASRTLRSIWTPVVFAFVAGIGAYLVAIAVFSKTYLDNVVPKLRIAYWGLNHPYSSLFAHHPQVFIGLPICWIAFAILRRQIWFPALAFSLGLAAVGSTLAYFQQHKGWTYQLIPAGLFCFLFLATTSIGILEKRIEHMPLELGPLNQERKVTLVTLVFCTVGAVLLGAHFERPAKYFNVKKAEVARIFGEYPAGTAAAYISTEPWDMPVVVEQNKVLGQRVNYFWLLPAILLGQDPSGNELHHTMTAEQIEDLSAYQRKSMAEDLAFWKPAIVIIDQCGPDLCESLRREHYGTILNWFLLSPQFKGQWEHYTAAGKTGDLEAFRRID